MPDDITPSTPAAEPKPSPNAEYAEKVAALERQRAEAERARVEREANFVTKDDLREILSETLQRNAPPPVDPNDPMSGIDDKVIDQVLNEGPGENPQQYKAALDEKFRRRDKQVLRQAAQEREAALQKERELAHAVQEMAKISRDLGRGDEILQEGSDLRMRAQRHMAQLQRVYGKEIALDPKAQIHAATMAQNEVLKEQNERHKAQEKELDEYKRKAQAEPGNKTVFRPSDETKDLLKKGKVDAAIKSMRLYDRLFRGAPQ